MPHSRRRFSSGLGRPAAALLAIALAHGDALGAPAPEGATFTVFSRPAVTRFPDVAHDAEQNVFLVVSGQQGVTARFVAAGGADGDAFEITSDPMAYSPRVAAVGGGFVVCWLVESTASVVCRSVARGASPVLGDEQVLTEGTVGHLESAPSLACARAASECLVTWVELPDLAVRGRRIALDAAPLGGVIDIAVNEAVFEAFPAVACAESRAEFLVAHTREPSAQPMAIAAQRVGVGSDSLAGTSTELYSANGLANYPEVAHDPAHQRYLAVSWFHEGNPDVAGRLIDADGVPIGDRIAVAATRGFEGGDGIGLTFDVAAESYLAVFQGPETPGLAQQVWAAPVSADGIPDAPFQVTSGPVDKGVYQPRVASDGAGRFLVVTVVDYQRVDGQFVTVDVPDAGTGGGGAAGTGGGGGGPAGSGGGSAQGAGPTREDGGCSCQTRRSEGSGWIACAAAGLVIARARRRRLRGRRR